MNAGYTERTREWLDATFGGYVYPYSPYQPVGGFRDGLPDRRAVIYTTRTYNILRQLRTMEISTFIDVGGAEGFSAHLVNFIFGARALTSDLSKEACTRARELFGLRASQSTARDFLSLTGRLMS